MPCARSQRVYRRIMGKITRPSKNDMDNEKIQAEVDAFVALPRAERKEAYEALPPEVKRKARKVIEARRGISHRADGGDLVLTKETYISEILRVQGRVDELPEKEKALKSKLAVLKSALQDNFGDDALGEAETALENRVVVANT